MRRRARWLLAGVGVAVVLGAGVVLGLPSFVKWLAIRNVRLRTGRELTLDDVRLNLATGRFEIRGLRVADHAPDPPLLEVERMVADFRLSWLLRLRFVARELEITGVTVRLVRYAPGRLNVSDLGGGGGGGGGLGAIPLNLEHMRLRGGRVTWEDRVPSPRRTVTAADIGLDLTSLTTRTSAADGAARLSFSLDGAPVTLAADQIGLVPGHARATLDVAALDLAPFLAYLPEATVRPTAGRLTAHLDLGYADNGWRAGGDVVVAEPRLARAGQVPPLVSAPALRLTVRDGRYVAGAAGAARIEVSTDPMIVDGARSPPARFDVRDLRLVVEGLSQAAGPPARLALGARLPGGGTLKARGTVESGLRAATVDLTLSSADVGLLAPYLPADGVVRLDRGRLEAALRLAATAGSPAPGAPPAPGVSIDGTLGCRGCVVSRRGQAEPFVVHPYLRVRLAGLDLRPGALALRRVTVDGAPSVVDATVAPAVRLDFARLELVADDVTWPARGRARVRGTAALVGGGRSTLEGTVHPGTLDADVRASFADLDVRRAAPYLPATSPVQLAGGRLASSVVLHRTVADGVRLDVDTTVADLDVGLRAGPLARVTDPRATLVARGLVLRDGGLRLASLAVRGAPTFAGRDGAGVPPLALSGLALGARDFAWPAGGAVPVTLDVALPGAGTVAASASVAVAARRADVEIEVRGASLGPLAGWLPVTGPLGGSLDAGLRVSARLGDPVEVRATGSAAGAELRLGDPGRPAASIGRLQLSGIEIDWPRRVRVARVVVTRPSVSVERDKSGQLPLREMFRPPGSRAGSATPATASTPPAPTPPGPRGTAASAGTDAAPSGLAWEVGEVLLEDGRLRFVDESTTPPYVEELSRLVASVAGLQTATAQPAEVRLQAVIGATGALDLRGQVAPGAQPFVLDLDGEIREMPLPRANPYFRRFFDWLLQRGSLTTKVHYRVVGDQLEGRNAVRIERLGVARDPSPVAADRKIGLPLGLIVSLVTDAQGDLEFSLPVQGRLNAPGFSLGGAIAAALKNVLMNLVTGPFRAIGKIFQRGDGEETVEIEPVTFAPGDAAFTAEGDGQLGRMADFLRAAPNARIQLRAVVGDDDLGTLKTADLAARIQQRQREAGLATFDAAAAALFRERLPGLPVPTDPRDVVDRLRDAEPAPDAAGRELAARRLEAVRQGLEARGGVAGSRIGADAGAATLGDPGTGRVELDLRH